MQPAAAADPAHHAQTVGPGLAAVEYAGVLNGQLKVGAKGEIRHLTGSLIGGQPDEWRIGSHSIANHKYI